MGLPTKRYNYKNNKLLDERYNLLDSIDFVWDRKTPDSNNSDDEDDDNNNNDDNNTGDDANDAISSRSDVNVDVHQSREDTGSSSSRTAATATKRLPHCCSTSHNSNDAFTTILTINDDVKQPAVATNATTTTPTTKISRTIKIEKQDIDDSNKNSANDDDEDDNVDDGNHDGDEDNNDDDNDTNDNDNNYKPNVKHTDDVNIQNDSYYDDWVTGNWAYLNEDGDNTCGSRKRKRNITEEEENVVIAINDHQHVFTKRNPKRQLTPDDVKSWAHMFDELQ